MLDTTTPLDGPRSTARRLFLRGTGKTVLSATAVALIAGCETMASSHAGQNADAEEDAGILNVALGLEHEAIAAYQIGAESGLLSPAVVPTAVLFQSHHKEHRDALVATVEKLGGEPVAPESMETYAASLEVASLANQTDVLALAARLERDAANAYLSVIPVFADRQLSQVAGRLAADETMHWSLLASALGEPAPQMALSFGA